MDKLRRKFTWMDGRYTDERQAREAFASAEGLGWNCYLWELAPRHEPHNAMFSGDPRDADDTTGRR